MNKITIILVMIVLVLIGVYIYVQNNDAPVVYTNESNDYRIKVPQGWQATQLNQGIIKGVVFSKVGDTDTIPAQILITKQVITDFPGVENLEQWYQKGGIFEGSDFFIEKTEVTINDLEMSRIITQAEGSIGNILTYIYATDEKTVIALSHFPYDKDSDSSKTFENLVQSFEIVALK